MMHPMVNHAGRHPIYTYRLPHILCQIMVTFLSYISNACHSLSGVAERLQHTVYRNAESSFQPTHAWLPTQRMCRQCNHACQRHTQAYQSSKGHQVFDRAFTTLNAVVRLNTARHCSLAAAVCWSHCVIRDERMNPSLNPRVPYPEARGTHCRTSAFMG